MCRWRDRHRTAPGTIKVEARPHFLAQAVRAVRTIGTNSFLWLAKMIRTTDPLWKRVLLAINARQSRLHLPVTPASVVRARAVEGYTTLGRAANENVPVLIQMMRSETSPEVRACIAAALGGIGPGAKAAIPVLEQAAEDKNAEVRRNAVYALANIQMWTPEVLPRGPIF